MEMASGKGNARTDAPPPAGQGGIALQTLLPVWRLPGMPVDLRFENTNF